jgi:hypothetical protein
MPCGGAVSLTTPRIHNHNTENCPCGKGSVSDKSTASIDFDLVDLWSRLLLTQSGSVTLTHNTHARLNTWKRKENFGYSSQRSGLDSAGGHGFAVKAVSFGGAMPQSPAPTQVQALMFVTPP